jgi:putative methionine-R-sulfoxide reductase with GAF domain
VQEIKATIKKVKILSLFALFYKKGLFVLRVVFLDFKTVGNVDISKFRKISKIKVFNTTKGKKQTIKRVKNADIIITNKVVIDKDILKLESTYAFEKEAKVENIKIGEGLIGQVAKDGQSIQIDIKDQIDLKIKSGLGESKPNYLYLLPVKKEGKIKGVVELAVFIKLSNNKLNFLKELFEK